MKSLVDTAFYFIAGHGRGWAFSSSDIMGTTLEFKKSSLKNIGFKYKESSLIVQALKALGQEYVSSATIKKIRDQIDEKMYDKILKDTKTATSWIYEIIKEICKKETI